MSSNTEFDLREDPKWVSMQLDIRCIDIVCELKEYCRRYLVDAGQNLTAEDVLLAIKLMHQ